MKFCRFLSALLFGLGCILSFIGLMPIVSPETAHFLAQSVQAFFSPVQNWPVLYLGLLILGAGAELLLRLAPEKADPNPLHSLSSSQQDQANPFARAIPLDRMPGFPANSFPVFVQPPEQVPQHIITCTSSFPPRQTAEQPAAKPCEPMPQTHSRIRSTMGVHHARKQNFSQLHS